jgi:hypothetical protein
MVYCSFQFQKCWMYVHTHLDNVPSAKSEEVVGEALEQQQFGEGKCPQPIISYLLYNLLPRIL